MAQNKLSPTYNDTKHEEWGNAIADRLLDELTDVHLILIRKMIVAYIVQHGENGILECMEEGVIEDDYFADC